MIKPFSIFLLSAIFFSPLISFANTDIQKSAENFSKSLKLMNEFVATGTNTYRHDFREASLNNSINLFHSMIKLNKDEFAANKVHEWMKPETEEFLVCQPQKELATIAAIQAPLGKMNRGITGLSKDTKKKGLSLIGSVFTESYELKQSKLPEKDSDDFPANKVFNRCKIDIKKVTDYLNGGGIGKQEFLGVDDVLTAIGVVKDIWNGLVGIGEAVATEIDNYKREKALRKFLTKDITTEKFEHAVGEIEKFIEDYSSKNRLFRLGHAIIAYRQLNEALISVYKENGKNPTLGAVSISLKKKVRPNVERFISATDAYDVYFDAGSPAPIQSLKSSFRKLVKQAKDDSFSINDFIETAERLKGVYEDIQKRVKTLKEKIEELKALKNEISS